MIMVSLVSPIPPYLGTQTFKGHLSASRTQLTQTQHAHNTHATTIQFFFYFHTMAGTAMEALSGNWTLPPPPPLFPPKKRQLPIGYLTSACLNTGPNNKKLINPVCSQTFSTFYHQKMIPVYLVMVNSWHRNMLAIFDPDNFLNWIRICLYVLRDFTNSSFMLKRYLLWLTKSEYNILLANNLAYKPMNFGN